MESGHTKDADDEHFLAPAVSSGKVTRSRVPGSGAGMEWTRARSKEPSPGIVLERRKVARRSRRERVGAGNALAAQTHDTPPSPTPPLTTRSMEGTGAAEVGITNICI